MGPLVDHAAFPIRARHVVVKNQGEHVARQRAICKAVAKALSLPAGVAVSAETSYATLSTCGTSIDGPCVEYRVRINGFAFGLGSKKTTEYLAASFVGMNAAGEVVVCSEDLQADRRTPAYWKAVNAGLPPPKPPKPNPRLCALLTFVDAKDEDEAVRITAKIRSLVAAVAPPPKSR